MADLGFKPRTLILKFLFVFCMVIIQNWEVKELKKPSASFFSFFFKLEYNCCTMLR